MTPGGLIFDLDGTLLDTLDDLTTAVNAVLAEHGRLVYTPSDYRRMLGHGLRNLLQQVWPGCDDTVVARTEAVYRATRMSTRPFPGVVEVLARIDRPAAVLTNKPQTAASELVHRHFGDRFAGVFGGTSGTALKPHPDAIARVTTSLGWSDAWMIGDSEVDIAAGRNAGLFTVGCTWGYRGREWLANADVIIEHPMELLALLTQRLAPP